LSSPALTLPLKLVYGTQF